MKSNDFISGDRCVAVVLSDSIDNVCVLHPYWVTGKAYLAGDKVSSGGSVWISLTVHTDAVTPVEGAVWTKATDQFTILPSIILCDTTAGNVKITTYGGDVVTLSITQGGQLASGSIRAKRVWATGTTAAGIYAVAE